VLLEGRVKMNQTKSKNKVRIKGISSAVATIIIATISITLVGTTYFFSQGLLKGATAETFEIIDVFSNMIIVRNLGTQPIENFTVLVDGMQINAQIKEPPVEPGKIGTVVLNLTDVPAGRHELVIMSKSMSQRWTWEFQYVSTTTSTTTSFTTTTEGIHGYSIKSLSEKEKNENPDFEFSSKKTIILNITKHSSFEKYIDLDVIKENETRFLVTYNFNKTILDDILKCKLKSGWDTPKLLELKNKHFTELSTNDLIKSVDNITTYPVSNFTPGIKSNINSIDLSVSGSFYIDLLDYDPSNISKSVGKKVRIGFNTIEWTTVESTNNVGQDSSIALDSNGYAHISYRDTTNYDLRYCNNTLGYWTCTALDITTNSEGYETSIAIDSNDKVHISHRDSSTSDLRYCTNAQGTWSCTAVDTVGNVGAHSSIAIDKNDKVHISHRNYTGSYSSLRYCNNTFGTWTCTNVEVGASGIGSLGWFSSIAIDSNNKVHISHQNFTGYVLRYCNNTLGYWTCTNVEKGGSIGLDTSIAIDSNDKVHISHRNSTSGAVRYCNNILGTWTCTNVDTTGTLKYTSIAIDNNDKVHISHGDDTNFDLRYCNNTLGTWTCGVVDNMVGSTTGEVYTNGRGIAMKKGRLVDSTSFSPNISISYYDSAYKDLKYARLVNYLTADTTPPRYFDNSTNSTTAGRPTLFSVRWTDNALDSYIFYLDNCTGVLDKKAESKIPGHGWVNLTYVISDTVGCTIRWNVTANDTSNNKNYTYNSFITTPGWLNVSLLTPNPSVMTNVYQYSTLWVNATITCMEGSCGNVYGTVRYNKSSANPDTAINTSEDTPFYITSKRLTRPVSYTTSTTGAGLISGSPSGGPETAYDGNYNDTSTYVALYSSPDPGTARINYTYSLSPNSATIFATADNTNVAAGKLQLYNFTNNSWYDWVTPSISTTTYSIRVNTSSGLMNSTGHVIFSPYYSGTLEVLSVYDTYAEDIPNTLSCGPMSTGSTCQLNWTVNATGTIDSAYKVGVLFNSSYSSVTQNHTNNATIRISGGNLEVNLTYPPIATTNVYQNTTFNVNATVTCRNADCGNVNGTVRYNASSANPDTAINSTTGATPFYNISGAILQSCGSLFKDQSCQLNWTVNATGDLGKEYKIGTLFNSSYNSVKQNHTNNATVKILGQSYTWLYLNWTEGDRRYNKSEVAYIYANCSGCIDGNSIKLYSNYTGTISELSPHIHQGNSVYNYTYTSNLDLGPYLINATTSDYQHTLSYKNYTLTVVDEMPPRYSDNSTNSTTAGTAVEFSVKWIDNDDLSKWLFCLDNCTGTCVNDTQWQSFSSNPAWSNTTRVINSTPNCIIRWKVYVNDSSNNGNVSENIFNTTPQKPINIWNLAVRRNTDGQPITESRTGINVIISVNVSGDISYVQGNFTWPNGTIVLKDLTLNETANCTHNWTYNIPLSMPCSEQFCNYPNASIKVTAYDIYGYSNSTNTTLIILETVELTVYGPVNFSMVNPGSQVSAIEYHGWPLKVYVAGNTPINLSQNASSYLSGKINPNQKIKIENITWNTSNSTQAIFTNINTSYKFINKTNPFSNQSIYYKLFVPPVEPQDYGGDIYICGMTRKKCGE